MVCFRLLQQRSCKAKSVTLSPTMDLVVTITTDGTLSLYRTFTWEKVLSKSCSEFQGVPSLASFSCNGKVLCIAGNGLLCAVNIETGSITDAIYTGSTSSPINIISLSWATRLVPHNKDNLNLMTGDPLQARFGVPEIPDEATSSIHLKVCSVAMEYLEQFRALPQTGNDPITAGASYTHSILLSLSSEFTVFGHAFGVFPVFSVSLPAFSSVSNPRASSCFYVAHSIKSQYLFLQETGICQDGPHYTQLDTSSLLPGAGICSVRCAAVFLSMLSDVNRLADMTASLGRKWKDATRVVTAKLSLLQTSLDGYQLAHSPIEFLYSIVLCGMWHPAAHSIANQWNEQGLSRLRSAVDSASRGIIETILSKMIPIATNLTLSALDLMKLQATAEESPDQPTSPAGTSASLGLQMMRAAEQLLFKLDETLVEARRCREAMLLLLQFIRECATPSDAAASLLAAAKVDIALRPKLLKMLDPRVHRSELFGRLAQAEAATATYLFAYLQDQLLPNEIIAARREKEQQSEQQLGELFCAAEGSTNEECNQRQSLATQVKIMKDSIETLYKYKHISHSLSEGCVVGSSKDVFDEQICLYFSNISTQIKPTSSDVCYLTDTNISNHSGAAFAIEEGRFTVIGYCDDKNNCSISVLCKSESQSTERCYYLANSSLGLVGTIDLIAFYHVPKSGSAFIVGIVHELNAGVLEKKLFKFSLEELLFEQVQPSYTENKTKVCFEIKYCYFKDLSDCCDIRDITVSRAKSIVTCGARGVLSILEEDGKVLLLDMEDNEDDNDEED